MKTKNIALVTGGDGGFGREFVKLLLKEPDLDEIWCVARSEDRLNALRDQLGDKIIPIPADLTDRAALNALGERLDGEGVCLRWLINNAGFDKFGPYDAIDVDTSLNMIDLNVAAPVALGLRCIPHMEGGSHILNISSQAAFFPIPYMNLYAATKVFLRHYTRALNVELRGKGITATAVCPGWMKTGLFDRAETGAGKGETVHTFAGLKEPGVVAAKALRDAKKGRDMSTCGTLVKASHITAKLVPQRLAMWTWNRHQGIK